MELKGTRPRSAVGKTLDGDPLLDLGAEGLNVDAIERELRVSEPVAGEAGEATRLAASATESGAPTGDGDDTDEAPSKAVASITARLDTIEARLADTTLPARVIDAGEGVTLLRVFGETTFTHGETVEVTIRDGETAAGTDDEE